MLRWMRALMVLAVVTWPSSGCHEERVAFVYEPPLTIDDLARGLEAPNNAFLLLSNTVTTGRFASPLAIAKLEPRQDHLNGAALEFVQMKPNEEAYWTEQMRGVIALQELIFLRPRTTKPEGQTLEALCGAARRLEAPLLLIYAPNALGPNSAQVFGVLYDTATHRPLATLHASSTFLDTEGMEVSPDEEEGDFRQVDAHYQAQREFEKHALACMRAVIHLDHSAPTTQPHGWDQPFLERWWIKYK